MNKLEKKKLPNHLQYDTVSPATKLLEKRRKMYEVHEAFEQQKNDFKKSEDIFKRQEEQIRQRDMQIQEDLIKFCKFLQDNETKKKRAETRFNDEKKAKELKEKEIQDHNQQLTELQRHQQKLEQKVTALKKYEDYLDSILKAYPDQYTDIQTILDRYFTLSNSNRKLVQEHQAMEKEYEDLKFESSQYETVRNQEILQLNNEIKDLQKRLEEKSNERNQLQQVVEASNNDAQSKNLNLGRILMAIDNLYNRCLDGTKRIKHEAEEAKSDKQNKDDKKQKGKDKNKKDKKDEEQDNDEDNYQAKSKLAESKLKQIQLYMIDFKKIIEACKAEQQKAKDIKR